MSRLDDRSIGEFVGWLVHELGWLVAQWVDWWFGRFVRRWVTDFCVGGSVDV